MGAVSQTWEWTFEHPPAAMWPLLADTARFNEAARLPKHQITEIAQPDGSVHYFGAARIGLFDIRWQEQPVNWVSEQWFEHTRLFRNGPLKVLIAELRMEVGRQEHAAARYGYDSTFQHLVRRARPNAVASIGLDEDNALAVGAAFESFA